ncbi:Hypothetical protein NTJ_00304 [Nesidiocoris tenuis]|uniref:PHD-type domain-containing protein n=1 Tax=Nesidiocoris tenuis TaxID=355587 RepID=A0ABN7A8B6_9HEMI|nr:Hypothetical protein NTJ_00304 [Nesidiocoris tenuis]
MDDPLYQQLEKALNLLVEGSAKINFLMGKLEMKITDLEDEEIAKQIQQNLFIEQNIDAPGEDGRAKSRKEKATDILGAILACKEKCASLQCRIRQLIDMKDTLLCQSIQECPSSNTELLPQASRIERMVLELTMEITECSVCTEMVNKAQSIWSCKNCYNIYHLSCANKCMQATSKNGTWSCPYCREPQTTVALGLKYTCFCGRVQEPKNYLTVTPHGCGQSCLRKCGNVCHPGPCRG